MKEKIIIYEKEIRNLKEENKINKNKINYQKKQITDLNEKIVKKDEEIKTFSENRYRNSNIFTPYNDDDSKSITSINKYYSQIQIDQQQQFDMRSQMNSFSTYNKEEKDNMKDKEINKLKRKINKLVINLSQKDQNILILNDDVINLEEQLNELNEKNKIIKKENENLKKIITKNNIKI